VRIVSKFKDYYDCGLAQGIDDDVLYVREHKEVDQKHPFLHRESISGGVRHRRFNRYMSYEPGIELLMIGFCGRIYPLAIVRYEIKRPPNLWDTRSRERTCYFYDLDSIVENAKRIRLRIDDDKHPLRFTLWGRVWHHFKEPEPEWKQLENWFQEYKVPAFIAHYPTAGLLNPCLKDFEFYKIFDAWTAFQELSMFIPGVLGGSANPTVEVGEEYRIAGHGYDKGSFRMPKGAKPNRKSRKKGKR
jgi:hypothetical protein